MVGTTALPGPSLDAWRSDEGLGLGRAAVSLAIGQELTEDAPAEMAAELRHNEQMEWAGLEPGERIDPTCLDAAAINRRLSQR